MVQLFFSRSDGPASFINLLHHDATFMIPPRTTPFLLRTSERVLRPNPRNCPPGGFEAQPTKPLQVAYFIRVPRYSTHVIAVLDRLATKSSRAPLDSFDRLLDSVNTVTPPCTFALVDIPRCQPPRLVTRPSGPSV
jgi:hypothetical protein